METTAWHGAFIRGLADRLADIDIARLVAKTGLPESIVREITEGKFQDLLSWEMVSTCVTAAGLRHEAIVQLRELWAKTEAAQWTERSPRLLRDIEQEAERARRRHRYEEKALNRRLFSEYRPIVAWRKTAGLGHPNGRWSFEPWSSTQLLHDQKIPDPDHAMSLAEFYELLRQLSQWAGRPSYNEIEQRSWGALSRTTAATVLAETRPLQRQVRDQDNVRYLAAVFGLPQSEVDRWIQAYNRVRELPATPQPHAAEQAVRTDRSHGTSELSPAPAPAAETESPSKGHTTPSPEASSAASAAKIVSRSHRWRTAALCFALSTAVLGIVMSLMVAAGDPPEARILQFPEKQQLFPGRAVRIPLKLAEGDWGLTLHFRLESTEVASACVHDAQLSYVVENANGVDIASGRTTRGESDSSAPVIRLHPVGVLDSPQVVVSVSVPRYDIGCGFTIDLSGSIVRPH